MLCREKPFKINCADIYLFYLPTVLFEVSSSMLCLTAEEVWGSAPSPWDSSAKECLQQEAACENEGWERCSICQDCLKHRLKWCYCYFGLVGGWKEEFRVYCCLTNILLKTYLMLHVRQKLSKKAFLLKILLPKIKVVGEARNLKYRNTIHAIVFVKLFQKW